jgi:hypothetical protein
MTRDLHLAFSIGLFFLGVGMIWGISNWVVGIPLIIVGIVWTLLSFVPNSLRKKLWIDDKIIVLVDDIQLGSNLSEGYPAELGERILRVGVQITSSDERRIEKMGLRLKRKLFPLDIKQYKAYYRYFNIPAGIQSGKHKACIVVYTNKGFAKSRSFSIETQAESDEKSPN